MQQANRICWLSPMMAGNKGAPARSAERARSGCVKGSNRRSGCAAAPDLRPGVTPDIALSPDGTKLAVNDRQEIKIFRVSPNFSN
jgi:hypothetical protein